MKTKNKIALWILFSLIWFLALYIIIGLGHVEPQEARDIPWYRWAIGSGLLGGFYMALTASVYKAKRDEV